MTTFRLTIDCDSEDLSGANPEGLAALLHRLAHRIGDGELPTQVMDRNGNTVGTVELVELCEHGYEENDCAHPDHEPADTVRCRLCDLIIEVDDAGDWHDLTSHTPYNCGFGDGTVHEPAS